MTKKIPSHSRPKTNRTWRSPSNPMWPSWVNDRSSSGSTSWMSMTWATTQPNGSTNSFPITAHTTTPTRARTRPASPTAALSLSTIPKMACTSVLRTQRSPASMRRSRTGRPSLLDSIAAWMPSTMAWSIRALAREVEFQLRDLEIILPFREPLHGKKMNGWL